MGASYDIRIDWNNDGDFSDTGENVTSRTLARTAISIQYGRDQYRALSPPAPGRANLELDDTSRDYSPENSSSPLAGLILPARPLRIQATLSAVTYTPYRGHLDDFDPLPDIGNRSVAITALDALAKLRDDKVSTALYPAVRTGEAIGVILDSIGWPAADRDLDAGATTMRWWWAEGDAWSAIEQILASEGPSALITVDGDGRIVFRDRHHRLIRAASTTSQATFRDTGAEPLFSAPLGYDHGWQEIINFVSLSVDERGPDAELSAVWTSDQSYAIADGQTLAVKIQTSDPFHGALTPVAGTDYQLRSGTITLTLSRSSGQSATISIRASGGPAVLDSLQLRAYAVPVRRTTVIEVEDSTSISRYGRRSYPHSVPWAGVHDAQAIATMILAQRAERLPIVSIRIVGSGDTRLTQILARDLSDRITIIDAETGLNADFYIEQIRHVISSAGLYHEGFFGCEKVPTQPSTVFRFDTTGAGFDDGVFGVEGLDDPAAIFIWDHATQGKFDVGVFAT